MQKNNKTVKSKSRKTKRQGNGVRFRPLPETMDVALTSTYKWNTTVSVGAITNSYVNGSDLNEFQPYYYDQLMTIYKNFLVLAVDIEYRIVNRSLSSEAEVVLCEMNRKNYDSGVTWVIASSLPGASRVFLTSTGNSKTVIVKRRLDFKHYYKGGFAGDSDFWGDFYTAPPICTDATRKDNIYSLLVYGAANGSDTINFTTDRRITYHARFFNFWTSNISATTDSAPYSIEDKQSRPERKVRNAPNSEAKNRPGVQRQRRDDRPPEYCASSSTTFAKESDDDEGAPEVINTSNSGVRRQGAQRVAR